ncbi:MAG: glycosyltransferase [bacterium]|nr:glycosyltransferase [bacterium]
MTPRVSIIIPIYNGQLTLARCLASVITQSYSDFEIITVDNDSTDSTPQILKEYQHTDARIKIFLEKERSRGAARATGEKHALGEIIVMIDDDCVAYNDTWLITLIGPLLQSDTDIVQGFETPLEKNFWSEIYQKKVSSKFDKTIIQPKILGNIDTKNLAVKKTVLEKVGGSFRKYKNCNDLELSIRLAKQPFRITFEKNALVYHKNPGTMWEVIKKQSNQGYWVSELLKDHSYSNTLTTLKHEKNQTLTSFFHSIARFIKSIFRESPKIAFFNLITGIAWRAGGLYSHILRRNERK